MIYFGQFSSILYEDWPKSLNIEIFSNVLWKFIYWGSSMFYEYWPIWPIIYEHLPMLNEHWPINNSIFYDHWPMFYYDRNILRSLTDVLWLLTYVRQCLSILFKSLTRFVNILSMNIDYFGQCSTNIDQACWRFFFKIGFYPIGFSNFRTYYKIFQNIKP